jgi:hypothetical protein
MFCSIETEPRFHFPKGKQKDFKDAVVDQFYEIENQKNAIAAALTPPGATEPVDQKYISGSGFYLGKFGH